MASHSRGRAGRVWLAVVALLAASPGVARAQDAGEAAGQAAGHRTVTLDEALQLAAAVDPLVVSAASNASMARADRLQARGALLPSLSANGVYGNSSNQRFDQASGRLVSQSYTNQLQASYEVFSGGRKLAQLRSAGAGVAAAEAREREQAFGSAYRTKLTFYAAAAARDLARVAEQRLARAKHQQEFAAQRFDVGTATRSDVLRAEIEVQNADLAVFEARSALENAALELGRAIGVAEKVWAAESALPEKAPELPSVEELVHAAAQSSPSVVAAEAARASRHADRLASYTPYLPVVRLSGGYDWFSYDFPPAQQSWSLRVTASLPLFNGLQREAGVQRAAAQERAAEAAARDARLAARVDVEGAVRDLEVAERQIQVADRTVELAEEDLRVQEERYTMGAATILELQASQVALAEAQVAGVRARQGLGGAMARLESILGERLGEEQ